MIEKNNGLHEWEQIAEFWDSKTKDGNAFYTEMVAPAAKRLLNLSHDDEIVEFACSSGLFARDIAPSIKSILSTDYSENFIKIAKSRIEQHRNIEHKVLDCTDLSAIKSLGQNRFNKAVCNMAIFDMAEIKPLFEGLSFILKP